uniref:Riboflavin kinase n=1 Tax=Helicotheca tamesis TaxID=374047 RepID=A0A7S2IKA7_9STRA
MSKMFKHIPIIVAGDDEAVKNGKPAPDIYVEAARRLGVHPSECLVFEDGVPGAKSGSAAGCQVIAVPDPRMDKSVFHAIADVVLDDLWHFNGERWGLELNMADVKNQLSVSV